MLSKQIAGQSLPLLPLPCSHLHIFVHHPCCLFPCPLGGAGWVCWLSAQQMQLCRCKLPLAGKREGSCLGNSLEVWADDFHPSSWTEIGRIVLEEKTMVQHILVKLVAGTEVQVKSVLSPFLYLCRENRVRIKSPSTPQRCVQRVMHMNLSTLGWCIPRRSCEGWLAARWGLSKYVRWNSWACWDSCHEGGLWGKRGNHRI